MKDRTKKEFIGWLLWICLLCITACNTVEWIDVDAKILSINTKILQGQTIGGFLSSASGAISNDKNKAGVSFTVKNELYLVDLELNHAELFYYKDAKELNLKIKHYNYDNGFIKIYLNGRYKGTVY